MACLEKQKMSLTHPHTGMCALETAALELTNNGEIGGQVQNSNKSTNKYKLILEGFGDKRSNEST